MVYRRKSTDPLFAKVFKTVHCHLRFGVTSVRISVAFSVFAGGGKHKTFTCLPLCVTDDKMVLNVLNPIAMSRR